MYVQLQCIVHVMCLVCMCIRMYLRTLLYVGDVMHLRTCAQVERKYSYIVCNVYVTDL